MGQHLAVVGEPPRDVAEGPRLEQLDLQLRAIGCVGVLLTLQSVPGASIAKSRRRKAHGALTCEDLADYRADPTIQYFARDPVHTGR